MQIELWINFMKAFNDVHFLNSISLSKFAFPKVQKEIIIIYGPGTGKSTISTDW
jgi:hypothetical protein